MPVRNHIVLVEPNGDILFEGDSLLRTPVPPPPDDVEVTFEDEPCPPTMRSADSGMFPSTRPRRAA